MKGALGAIVAAMFTFYIANIFLTELFTGTDAGTTLLLAVGPILLSLVVLVAMMKAAGIF